MIRFKNTEAKPQSYKLKRNLEVKEIKEKRNKRFEKNKWSKKNRKEESLPIISTLDKHKMHNYYSVSI